VSTFEIHSRVAQACCCLSLAVLAAAYFASILAERSEGNSLPAFDLDAPGEVAPLVAGRAALDGLVAANDREAA
jgi:hypothetical protein